MSKLFAPYDLSGTPISNRVVMAPTRTPENISGELTALYYAQRASAALIITEDLRPRHATTVMPKIQVSQ